MQHYKLPRLQNEAQGLQQLLKHALPKQGAIDKLFPLIADIDLFDCIENWQDDQDVRLPVIFYLKDIFEDLTFDMSECDPAFIALCQLAAMKPLSLLTNPNNNAHNVPWYLTQVVN